MFFGVSVADKFVKTYQINNLGSAKIFIFQFISYNLVGMIFGLEKIFGEMNKIGSWKVNLPRLIVVGLPSFLVGTYIILFINYIFIPQFLNLNFVNFALFINFMQMLFGYILVTSFYKVEEIKLN